MTEKLVDFITDNYDVNIMINYVVKIVLIMHLLSITIYSETHFISLEGADIY